MVSVLVKRLGPQHLELAEDLVQETMVDAMRLWPVRGKPPNPAAWLHTVARNKAIDWQRQQRIRRTVSDEKLTRLSSNEKQETFLEDEITDSQLRMVFACCHPALAPEVQMALVLNLVGGFGPDEVARAFVEPVETVKKRLVRAKQKFREGELPFEVPQGPALHPRLQAVLASLYLLFNEGYATTRATDGINKDICLEALRLALLIAHHAALRHADALALVALMCFQASRFEARVTEDGRLLTLEEQDRGRWHQPLIQQGVLYLDNATPDGTSSRYHFEAAIARMHSTAVNHDATDWEKIVKLYEGLEAHYYSPIVQLNRAVAISRAGHTPEAFALLRALAPVLDSYYLYHAVAAELSRQMGELAASQDALKRALACTVNGPERALLQHRLLQLQMA